MSPPIVPPSNKTFEPVTSPLALTLKFEDDIKNPLAVVTEELIKKEFPAVSASFDKSKDAILPPVNKTLEPVIFPEPLNIKDSSGLAIALEVIVKPPILPASAVIVPCIVTSPCRDK